MERTHEYRVADHVVRGCVLLGARYFFGVDGANIEDIYDAAQRVPEITAVIAKHEFSAATMAAGYARATGNLGVVVATSGGGAMNLLPGLAEAYTSRIPLLAFVGQPPTVLEGNGAFQDTSGRAGTIDARRLFGAVSRYCARVETAADLPGAFGHAVAAARTGGPAVALLPKDVQQTPIDPMTKIEWQPSVYPDDDEKGMAAVIEALVRARRIGTIVVIAGDQVARDDARTQLWELADILDAAVGVTPDAKDVYRSSEPGYCGVSGVMGHPDLLEAMRDAQLCLLVGTRLPVMAGPLVGPATLASLGAEPPYRPSIHATSGNLAGSLVELAVALGRTPRTIRPTRRSPSSPPPESVAVLRYHDAVATISAALPAGSAVVADAGNTGAAVVHYLDLPAAGRFGVALGMGGMGYSFGAGIGTAFATAEPTFVIAGDGAFFMHGMEIHTAIEYRLPVTFIVFNNNAHAMCVTREQLFYDEPGARNRFQPSKLAEGMAALFPTLPAYAATTVDELREALARPVDGPKFIAVQCDADEIPPFVPFRKGP